MNKAHLMAVYNKAKSAARGGLTFTGRRIEAGRVNRAFGILQRKNGLNSIKPQYATSVESCQCYDSQNTLFVCKHRLAYMMTYRMAEIEVPAPLMKSPSGGFLTALQEFASYRVIVVDSLETWEIVKGRYDQSKLRRPSKVQGRRLPDITHNWIMETLET